MERISSMAFNQDHSSYVCATTTGFATYSCDPHNEILRQSYSLQQEIRMVEMLFNSNIFAFVLSNGDGSSVMIWDNNQSRCVELLSFKARVCRIQLRCDCLMVVFEHLVKLYRMVLKLEDEMLSVYTYQCMKFVHETETTSNPLGVCALAPCSTFIRLAYPGVRRGEVELFKHRPRDIRGKVLPIQSTVQAHDSELACLSLSRYGKLLATASVKGTLIRVYDTRTETRVHELRRGSTQAKIYDMSFSPSIEWLAVSSDKGTVHVFSLKDAHRSFECNTGSVFGSSLYRYLNSDWSLARFHVAAKELRTIVAFSADGSNSLVILGLDGSYMKCEFDPEQGGNMAMLESQFPV